MVDYFVSDDPRISEMPLLITTVGAKDGGDADARAV